MSELRACPVCKSQNVSEPIFFNGYWWCEDCKNPFIPGIDGWVSIRLLDLEKNYVSRISFNARVAELESQQRWIPVSERLPEVIITNGECNFVLVKEMEAPECGSEYQTANTAYVNRHPERYTHWKYITPPTE